MNTVVGDGGSKRWTVIFVLGAPGAGKGTQCSMLSRLMEIQHISAGDLIRKERDTAGSEYGPQIADAIREPGTFVPSEITCELLRRAMNGNVNERFIIDGFPINWSNLETWEKTLAGSARVPCVLFLDIPEAVSVSRCLGRGRKDDTSEVLKKRFESYIAQTTPVVEYYREKRLLKTVDGTLDPKEVFQQIVDVLQLDGKKYLSGQNVL